MSCCITSEYLLLLNRKACFCNPIPISSVDRRKGNSPACLLGPTRLWFSWKWVPFSWGLWFRQTPHGCFGVCGFWLTSLSSFSSSVSLISWLYFFCFLFFPNFLYCPWVIALTACAPVQLSHFWALLLYALGFVLFGGFLLVFCFWSVYCLG